MTESHRAPGNGADHWRQLVDKALKGRPFSDLQALTEDGLVLEPLYPPHPGHAIQTRDSIPWLALQRIEHPDPEAANRIALADLNRGASGLSLVFSGAALAQGFGIAADGAALAATLRDVRIDACRIELESGADAGTVAGMLDRLIREQRIDPALVDIEFGIDPIGAMAANGTIEMPDIATIVSRLAERGYHGPFLVADGRIAHEAGASPAVELAFALATSLHYLRTLLDAGLDFKALAPITFRLCADADQFATMAKLRAVRLLWARLLCAAALPFAPVRVRADTSLRMLTRRDPHSNLVRATIATVAAGLGGADAVLVRPFTAAHGLPADDARRLALNTQTILIEEANLARVSESAGGAGAIETLTISLAQAAWAKFQQIEAAGGIMSALKSGLVQSWISAARSARHDRLESGSDVIIGTTLFAANASLQANVERPFPVLGPPMAEPDFEPLRPVRTAQAFEDDIA